MHFGLVLNVDRVSAVVLLVRFHLLLHLQALRRVALCVLLSVGVANANYTGIALLVFIWIGLLVSQL